MSEATSRRRRPWRGFRSVLCPIDFSKHSLVALRYADVIARRSGRRLLVQYVNDPLVMAAAGAAFHDRSLATTSRRELQTFADEALGSSGKSYTLRLLVSTGDPADEILKLAKRARADLIVVGTHGLTGAERILAGSTTLDLLQRTAVPVLAVPRAEDAASSRVPSAWPGRRIVAAVDLEAHPQHIVKVATDVAQWFGVPLRLLSVIKELSAPAWLTRDLIAHDRIRLGQAQHAIDRLAAAARRRVSTDTQVACGNAAEEVAAAVAAAPTGLVLTELADRRSWFGAKRASISYHVLSHGVAPVLAIPPHWPQRR